MTIKSMNRYLGLFFMNQYEQICFGEREWVRFFIIYDCVRYQKDGCNRLGNKEITMHEYESELNAPDTSARRSNRNQLYAYCAAQHSLRYK